MASFSPLTSGVSVFSAALLTEIDTAINERAASFGISSTFSTAIGANVQDHTYWSDRQSKITSIVSVCLTGGRYFLPTTDLEGISPSSAIPYTSTSGFWGLINSGKTGPRRATTSPGTYSSGNCVAGDIIGLHLMQDLRAACSFMSATIYHQTGTSNHTRNMIPDTTGTVAAGDASDDFYPSFWTAGAFPNTRTNAIADYNATSGWSGNAIGDGFVSTSSQHSGFWLQFFQFNLKHSSSLYTWNGYDEGGLAIISGLSSRAHTYKVYGVTASLSGVSIFNPPANETYAYNYRCLNHSSVSRGALLRLASITSASTATGHSVQIHGTYGDAVADSGITDNGVIPLSTTNVYGYNLNSESYWLVFYQWSYT